MCYKTKQIIKTYLNITLPLHILDLWQIHLLIPDNFSFTFEKGRRDLKDLSNEDGLFLTLIRYRRD